MEVTLRWASNAMGATLIGADCVARGVCIDTRAGVKDQIFFALPGATTDGHAFVAEALSQGAAAAVVSHRTANAVGRQILVESPVNALGSLARAWRGRFSVPVVGITGSIGKTSVRSMTAAIARTRFCTLESQGNFNTEIGVPLTLFGMEAQTEAVILELAMRGLGQIRDLCRIAAPTLAVITGIGSTHIGLLGSRSAIAEAKAEILAAAPEAAVLPAHDEFFSMLRERVLPATRLITYSADPAVGADISLRSEPMASACGSTAEVVVNGAVVALRIARPGTHHVRNALAALAAGTVIGVTPELAIEALAAWHGAAGRMSVREVGAITLLDDCYNAAPESMAAALATLAVVQPDADRRVAILGDMLELGDTAEAAHLRLGEQVAELGVRLLVTVGEFADAVMAAAQGRSPEMRGATFRNAEEAGSAAGAMVKPGDTVLVKGSRGVALETVVRRLEAAADV